LKGRIADYDSQKERLGFNRNTFVQIDPAAGVTPDTAETGDAS